MGKQDKSATSSADKGRLFEDEVAKLYRLLGAHVTQNIEVCQKKIDILATFPIQGARTKHRILVECKDEKRVVNANQRVMQYQGLLDIARKADLADSAEIVTRVPWGDAAKGFALSAGISLLTYSEKIAQLIDFEPYLKTVVKTFEEGDANESGNDALAKYYIDLNAELGDEKKTVIATEHIHSWLTQDQTKQLTILGEYGFGKTSLCQKIAHDLAIEFLEQKPSARIPILLNLREFVGTIRMEAFVTSFLDQECRVTNPRYELFQAMNEAGLFVLIFDGFDEMAVKVDSEVLEINLAEIEKLAVRPSKVWLTSRPEYFISAKEEEMALEPAKSIIPARKVAYDSIRLTLWEEPQIGEYLRRRVPLIQDSALPWTYYNDNIKSIKGFADLSHRPVLLEMIVRTLPKLIEEGVEANRTNLYKTYLSEEIRRQRVVKKRQLLFTVNDRLMLLRRLAGEVYLGRMLAISFADARHLVSENFKTPSQDLEAYTREFLSNSFLRRQGNIYSFSHKSFLEYLAAARIEEELREGGRSLLGTIELDPQCWIFWSN